MAGNHGATERAARKTRAFFADERNDLDRRARRFVGKRFETSEQFTLCRCGKSAQAPFCDGSHRIHRFDSCPRAAPPKKA